MNHTEAMGHRAAVEVATAKRDLIYGPIMLLRGQTIEVEVVERDGPWIPDPDITYAYIYVATANDGSEEPESPVT